MNANPASDLGRVGLLVAGKFRLDAVIGRGGMGSVWSATHVGLGHHLAIKLVAREFVRSPEALRRFDAEAKAAARLQSRHVVQVFDNGTLDDGTPYIAMELLAGENLEQRIHRAGPIALHETVGILAQCCKALARAHAAGIVHRDIKPDNIFLARTPDEDADVVKILDFGVAKMTMGLQPSAAATGTGAVLGTPLFMSPEQVRGFKDIDHRTDLYSLGIVSFTMLTGRLAIAGETFGEILIKICTEPLPSLRAAAPWLTPAIESWFQRACAREPADRFQSAPELIGALRTAAGDVAAELRATPNPTPPTLHSATPEETAATLAQSAAPVSVASDAATMAQSASPLSVAAGLPRRLSGGAVAGLILTALFAVGMAGLWAVLPRHSDTASPGSASAGSPGVPSAAIAPATAPPPPPPVAAGIDDDAGAAATARGVVAPRPPVAPPPLPAAPRAGAATAGARVALPRASAYPPPSPAKPSPAPPTTPTINLGY